MNPLDKFIRELQNLINKHNIMLYQSGFGGYKFAMIDENNRPSQAIGIDTLCRLYAKSSIPLSQRKLKTPPKYDYGKDAFADIGPLDGYP